MELENNQDGVYALGFKGKGKGKAGKGKGPVTGCWICGGPHYADKCPNNTPSARALSDWWDDGQMQQSGILSSLRESRKVEVAANFVERKTDVARVR